MAIKTSDPAAWSEVARQAHYLIIDLEKVLRNGNQVNKRDLKMRIDRWRNNYGELREAARGRMGV